MNNFNSLHSWFALQSYFLSVVKLGDVQADGVWLREPDSGHLLLSWVWPSSKLSVSALQWPWDVQQRWHLGGEVPAVPMHSELIMHACNTTYANSITHHFAFLLIYDHNVLPSLDFYTRILIYVNHTEGCCCFYIFYISLLFKHTSHTFSKDSVPLICLH